MLRETCQELNPDLVKNCDKYVLITTAELLVKS